MLIFDPALAFPPHTLELGSYVNNKGDLTEDGEDALADDVEAEAAGLDHACVDRSHRHLMHALARTPGVIHSAGSSGGHDQCAQR